MLFLLPNTDVPALNLACEEFYFKNSSQDVFMLWRNSPVVVVGKNQNVYDEVDLPFASAHSVGVIRRITGGGAVYHDHGNVNYSFITSRASSDHLDFAYHTRPMILALMSLGIEAELSGRNDLLCRGFKISGSAQSGSGERTLHHGTLLFDVDMEVLSHVLKPSPAKLASKHIASVRSRVSNLRALYPDVAPDTDAFYALLAEKLAAQFGCGAGEADLSAVKDSGLADKYFDEDFIFGRRVSRRFKKERRYDCGTVVFRFDAENGVITALDVEGDFFPLADPDALAAGLVGTPLELSALTLRLEALGASSVFPSVPPALLAEQILG